MRVVGLCDVDERTREATADQVSDLNGDQPKHYNDYRELLEKQKPEIVIIATPDHWHALQTIAAVKAGAHVFVEKPTGHTVKESAAMLRAAGIRRVVQVGLHRRIGPHHVSGMRFFEVGCRGEVGMVRLFAHSGGGREKPTANSEPPEGMDWNLWCGPAPLRPFNSAFTPGLEKLPGLCQRPVGDWGSSLAGPGVVVERGAISEADLFHGRTSHRGASDPECPGADHGCRIIRWPCTSLRGSPAPGRTAALLKTVPSGTPLAPTITEPRGRSTWDGGMVDVLSRR